MITLIKKPQWLLAIFMMLFASIAFGHGMSEAEKQLIIEGGSLQYIWIGATHMLSGYDHLAFVFGIIFFLRKFKDIVKYITVFTLGHSITLIFATFNAIQVNYFLVDAVIALSVVYIAFHNLDGFKKYLHIKAPNMLAMIFGFGLIHGLGLSTRLQQLPLNPEHLLMNIVSFNIGIEIGQIAALTIMLLVIMMFRKSHLFPVFSKISNVFLILAGGYLFLMQMHGYAHSSHPEEFMVNAQSTKHQDNTVATLPASNWTDTIQLSIPARGDLEYKLQQRQGDIFEYSWQTNQGRLFYDFHGEPKGDTTGYFKSFEKDTQTNATGTLQTTFAGTHGWYWKNNNAFPVTVTLQIKGDYQRLDLQKAPLETNPLPIKSTHDTL
ncbi:putative membrane protein [hydrothermal vent metagenome]|uniref:Putative membrane protein n=1 Tax=hydrothermal vent metagenome TaxID=652676 RepID=A0A3B0VQI3_9ZZZZ